MPSQVFRSASLGAHQFRMRRASYHVSLAEDLTDIVQIHQQSHEGLPAAIRVLVYAATCISRRHSRHTAKQQLQLPTLTNAGMPTHLHLSATVGIKMRLQLLALFVTDDSWCLKVAPT